MRGDSMKVSREVTGYISIFLLGVFVVAASFWLIESFGSDASFGSSWLYATLVVCVMAIFFIGHAYIRRKFRI
jgi:apolipoprotein N-acyltransferase